MPFDNANSSEAKIRILAVDDDPVLCAVAEIALEAAGYEALLAEDGQVAVDTLLRQPVDLMVLDIDMPNLNGYEVLKIIRATKSLEHLPVIVATGHDDLAAIDLAFDYGATSFVTKPVDWNVMLHHINFILRASRIEKDVRALKETAEATSKINSNMLAVITHEFRSPIHVISGFGQLIASEAESAADPIKLSDYVKEIVPAASRLNSILSDTILLSKAAGGDIDLQCEDYQTGRLIEQTIAGYLEITKSRKIEIYTNDHLGPDFKICCDKPKIIRAIGNLIENAIKFSPSNSTVTITLDKSENSSVTFHVHNTGSLLTSEKFDKVINPFSQGDMSSTRQVEGLGLGLPVAKVIAESHGGFISSKSSDETGTEISLTVLA